MFMIKYVRNHHIVHLCTFNYCE